MAMTATSPNKPSWVRDLLYQSLIPKAPTHSSSVSHCLPHFGSANAIIQQSFRSGSMNPTEPVWRDDIHPAPRLGQVQTAETIARHSSKIHDFFGIPSSEIPAVGCPINETSSGSDPRSSTTYNTLQTFSSKFKGPHPTIKMHTRRARRFLSTLIQSCTPVWYV